MCLNLFKKKVTPSKEITIKEGLAIIAEARYNHQYWIDHPEKLAPDIKAKGDLEFQKLWVDNYDKLRDLIERLK